MGLLVLPLVLTDLLHQPIDRIDIGHGFGGGLGQRWANADVMGSGALGENPLALSPTAVVGSGILDLLLLYWVGTAGGALKSIIMLLPPMPL